MKIAGVICEYNPFHFGHKYQLETIKKDFDAVVCVMSGSFVQRGDAAVYDKWTRAKAALLSGCDLVLELPVRHSLSSARDFAMGGCDLLEKTGVITSLCFGSECADIKKLSEAAEILENEPECVKLKIREFLNQGMSFKKARELAASGIIDSDILSRPNDILALEYISALNRTKSSIIPIAMERKSVDHNSTIPCGIYASATAIREKLAKGEDISKFTPFDFSHAEQYSTDRISDIFKYKLWTLGEDAFSNLHTTEPGLCERFLKFSNAPLLSDIIDAVKTKRYTHARLKRIALSVILGISDVYRPCTYIRVLGMNTVGREILAKMKKSADAPIVNKVADFKDADISEDILATDIAALCADRPIKKGRDFTTSPVYLP